MHVELHEDAMPSTDSYGDRVTRLTGRVLRTLIVEAKALGLGADAGVIALAAAGIVVHETFEVSKGDHAAQLAFAAAVARAIRVVEERVQ